MKLKMKSDRGLVFTADNPDEELKKYWRDKITSALFQEFNSFVEECSVTMRRLDPGQSAVIESKPIRVELSRPAIPEPAESTP